ncbi:hypothetical protein Nepgr_029780 [Nepenthes gracilis]|uniref:Uncharacterized protein n=1 Tax=Nepenthes gracilis TaxID=150966 RepID=A0AAD3TEJ4_NEPGR|nr:hypothetical protein Nepgr_029780 [Nepenthes gracilis]
MCKASGVWFRNPNADPPLLRLENESHQICLTLLQNLLLDRTQDYDEAEAESYLIRVCQEKSEFRDMDQKYSDGVSHEESQVSEIKKTCTDCGTSKTLLWIGGPVSPKPLHFFYTIIFSPYLFCLLSILAHRFITTTLLLLSPFTAIVLSYSTEQYAVDTVGQVSRRADEEDDELEQLPELEENEIEFRAITTGVRRIQEIEEENPVLKPQEIVKRKNLREATVQLPQGSGMGRKTEDIEWRKTLACKLFEESHNLDVGSGARMDLLWEALEKESRMETEQKEKKKTGRARKLCCFPGLKFPAGKLNLKKGRPNCMRISKIFKGAGWLSRHRKNKRQ